MAYNYQLLPFERHMAFRPNTMPMALSALGIVLSLTVLLGRRSPAEAVDADAMDIRKLREYRLGQAVAMLASMVAYALLLRPIGFLLATTLFLAGGGAILGERRFAILIPVAIAGALFVWYLVQEVLGIYLRPLPSFLQ